jgi:error-prone DNA polymerase
MWARSGVAIGLVTLLSACTGGGGSDDTQRFGIRLALQDVAGIDEAMVESLLAARPFTSVADLRRRSALSAPVAEALAHVGALDRLALDRSRRDILLEVAERWSGLRRHQPADPDAPVQLALTAAEGPAGLSDYTPSEQVRAELEVLGLDASRHVVRFYDALLARLGVTLAVDLEGRADRQRVRVAGAKVATQTPPVKSGQRVIFTSLDDGTGVSDSAFFEAVHDRCAATVFHSWLLVIEGRLVRRGRRGLSVTAERVWDLTALNAAWRAGRLEDALRDPTPTRQVVDTPRRLWHASGGSAGG